MRWLKYCLFIIALVIVIAVSQYDVAANPQTSGYVATGPYDGPSTGTKPDPNPPPKPGLGDSTGAGSSGSGTSGSSGSTGSGGSTGAGGASGSGGAGGSAGAGGTPSAGGACPTNEEVDYTKVTSQDSAIGKIDCTELNAIGKGKLCDRDFRKNKIINNLMPVGTKKMCKTTTKGSVRGNSVLMIYEVDTPKVKIKYTKPDGTKAEIDAPDPCKCGDLQVICQHEDRSGKKYTQLDAITSVDINNQNIDSTTKLKKYKDDCLSSPTEAQKNEACRTKCP